MGFVRNFPLFLRRFVESAVMILLLVMLAYGVVCIIWGV